MLHRRSMSGLIGGVVLCALVMTAGCRGETEPLEAHAPTTVALLAGSRAPATAPPPRPSEFTPWRAADVPAGVLGVLGVTSVRDLLVALTTLGAEVAPGELPPDLASELTEGLRQGFGFTDVSWLEREVPLYMVVVDPVAYPGVTLLVLPTDDALAVEKTFGPGVERDVKGHAAVWDHRGEPVCVDFLPGHVVLSRDLEAYGEMRSFIADAVTRWIPQSTVSLALETGRIQEVFADEMAAFKVDLETGEGSTIGPWLTCGIHLALSLVEHTDQLMVGLGLRDGALEATAALAAAPGSDYEALNRAMEGRQAPSGHAAPDHAWLVSLSDVDLRHLRVFESLEGEYWALLGRRDGSDRAGRAQVKALFEGLRSLESGPSVFSLYREETFPFAMLLVSQVADTAALRALSDDLLRRVFLHLRDAVEATLSEADLDVDLGEITTLKEFIPLFNDAMGPFGVETSLVEQVGEGVTVRGVRVTVDWEKTGLRELDPDFLKALRDTLGPRLEFAQAIGADHMAVALGPTAVVTAREAVIQSRSAPSKGPFRAHRGEALAISLKPAEGLRTFGFLPVFEEVEELASLGSDDAVTLGVRAHARGLVATARLPLTLLKAVVDLTL